MRAIGTTVSVAVTEPSTADDAATMLADDLCSLDEACSRFRPDSELRKLERSSRGRPVAVSALLFDVLEVACAVAVKTAGTVDPTVGSAVISLGYDRDFDQIEEPGWSGGRHRPRPAPGWWRVQLDPRERTVVVPSGIRIDVGATAKAWAADRAARTIAARLGGGVLVNLGGDVAVAGPPPPGGWAVGIAEYCTTPGDAVDQVVAMHAGGLATSGTTARSWVHNGRRVHHIIDPWSGEPAPTVWSLVSTAAASCVEANAWSTAAVVWGTDAVGALREREIPARLADAHGGVTLVGGWPRNRAVPNAVDGRGPGKVR
jgi:thiamine biosynthesis lipoprotein